MKQRLIMIAVLVTGALLQQLLPVWPLFGGVKPPVVAALVLHYALRRAPREMWTAVLVGALLHDGLELALFGPALLAFPAVGMLAQRIRNEIFSDGLVTQLFFGAALGLFTAFVALFIYSATGQRPFHFGFFVLRLIGAALLGMATLPLVSYSVNKLEAALPKPREYGWQ